MNCFLAKENLEIEGTLKNFTRIYDMQTIF